MKLWERVIEKRLREDKGFNELVWFMLGRLTTEAIHLIQSSYSLTENQR